MRDIRLLLTIIDNKLKVNDIISNINIDDLMINSVGKEDKIEGKFSEQTIIKNTFNEQTAEIQITFQIPQNIQKEDKAMLRVSSPCQYSVQL